MANFSDSYWTFNDDNGLIMQGEKHIAQVFGATKHNYEDNRSECFENARLIQFAPEMFNLLVDVLSECDTQQFGVSIKRLLDDINGEEFLS